MSAWAGSWRIHVSSDGSPAEFHLVTWQWLWHCCRSFNRSSYWQRTGSVPAYACFLGPKHLCSWQHSPSSRRTAACTAKTWHATISACTWSTICTCHSHCSSSPVDCKNSCAFSMLVELLGIFFRTLISHTFTSRCICTPYMFEVIYSYAMYAMYLVLTYNLCLVYCWCLSDCCCLSYNDFCLLLDVANCCKQFVFASVMRPSIIE